MPTEKPNYKLKKLTMEKISITNVRRGSRSRISWGGIIAGVITVFAISLLLSFLSTSIGFFKLDPLSENPASGIGTAVIIIMVISLIISFAAGGFVAGKLSGADGVIHGFLVWATTLILSVIFVTSLAAGAIRMTGKMMGSVTSAAGHVMAGAGSMAGKGASALMNDAEKLFGDIDFNSDTERKEIRKEVRQALRKSGVKELQPEYLDRQMKAVKDDLNKSVRKMAVNPKDADKIINGFMDRLQTRTQTITKNVDRNDITRAIANNTTYSQAEVEKAVDEYTEIWNDAVEQSKEELAALEQNIQEAKQEWEVMKHEALVEADKASNAAGRAALWSFFALLICGALCAVAGLYGTRMTKEGYEA